MKKSKYSIWCISLTLMLIAILFGAITMADNSYSDPSQLPEITELPNPFVFNNGTPLKGLAEWGTRREEIAASVQHYVYGTLPNDSINISANRDGDYLDITVTVDGQESTFTALISLPDEDAEKCPVFVNTGSLDEELFLSQGYALVKFSPTDIADDTYTYSGVFYDLYPDSEAGVLMAWAWGYQRVIDAILAAVPEIDPEQIVVTGHAQYGKAALLAGAFDNRVAITIPASSGLAGISTYRFFYEDDGINEKIDYISDYASWWFTPLFDEFYDQPERLPVDGHSVAALIAPRALLITQGTDDPWNNPQGTCLSYLAAKKVWQLLGVENKIGIACRPGSRWMNIDDFYNMLDFADKQFNRGDISTDFTKVPYDIDNLKQAIPWDVPTVSASPTKTPRPTRTPRPRNTPRP